MMGIKSFLVLVSVLGLAILACGMSVDLGNRSAPTPTGQPAGQNEVATMVAGTVQAFTQVALSATPAATLTATNTPLPPTLSVSVATNCYAGPRTDYGFVITIYPGTTVTVVGKDTPDNSWIIDVPGYPGTVCWLSGQNAKINGDTAALPAPATPVISIYTLSEPRNLRVSCTSESLSGTPEPWWHNASEWTVVFRWTNTDADQTGVRVYRNGRHLATLGAHASSFTESFFHQGRHGVTYAVQAVTSARVSSIVSIDVNHCR